MATLPLNPLESFHLFPRLPQELRNRIWKFAAFEPRVLSIDSFPPGSLEVQYFFSSDPAPAILSTCQESRSEALAFYTKAFSVGVSQRHIWTNFNADTIKIKDYCLSKVSLEERARMQWLTVESKDIEPFLLFYYPDDYKGMKELRELVILSIPEVSLWYDRIAILKRDFEEWYGGIVGWKCPEIKIVEKDTGMEMNFRNYQTLSGRGRWRGSLRADIARGGSTAGLGRGALLCLTRTGSLH